MCDYFRATKMTNGGRVGAPFNHQGETTDYGNIRGDRLRESLVQIKFESIIIYQKL